MNRAGTAREALIVEALGDVALLQAFDTSLSSMTQQAKSKAIEHIVRRTGEAARQSIETQTRAMNEAARLAFMGQAEATFVR